MSQYFLAVHHDPADDTRMAQMSSEQMQAVFSAVEAFNTELQETGAWVFAGGLMPIASSHVVDATGDETVTTEGPFIASQQYLGGFWVVEAPDLDAALAWAAKGSTACGGTVEVRPFQG